MKCQICKYKNTDDATFCAECGNKIEVPVAKDFVPVEKTNSNKVLVIVCGIIIALVVLGVAGIFIWQ